MSEGKMSARKKIENLKRGYKLCHETAPGYVGRSCVSVTLGVVVDYLGIYLSGSVVSIITGEKSFDAEIKAVLLYALLKLVISGLNILLNVSKAEQLEQSFQRRSKMMLAEKCARLDYAKVEDPQIHRMKEVAEKYMYGVGSRWGGLGKLFYDTGKIFETVVTAVIGFGVCFEAFFLTQAETKGFLQSVWAVLALFLIYGIILFFRVKILRGIGEFWSASFADQGYNQNYRILGFYMDYFTNRYQRGKDMRVYDQSKLLMSEWEKHNEENIGYGRRMLHRTYVPDTGSLALILILDIATYAFIIARAAGGMYTAAQATVMIMSITKLLNGMMRLLDFRVDYFDLVPQNIQNIFDFLDIPEEGHKGTFPTEKRSDNDYEFAFQHVSFRYPNSEEYVLRDICLKWKVGEKMALVGPNGSGKSTLIKLLCRLYDPTEGEITLNGVDIRKYSPQEYADLFSVVFQDAKLFSFSVAENVAVDVDYDGERVADCVNRAGLSQWLSERKEGIDVCLYKDFDENGVEISGGEAQKLCLARAIYKGAPFIVLDEPTAALDPISEHDIYTKFNAIVGTRTAIYISHRLSSCRFCDNITVIERGRVAERGSHEELLQKGGVYAKLWSAQAELYKETAGELFV